MTENSDGGEAVSFQSQIKPLFRGERPAIHVFQI